MVSWILFTGGRRYLVSIEDHHGIDVLSRAEAERRVIAAEEANEVALNGFRGCGDTTSQRSMRTNTHPPTNV
jgi:hypothetical protein